jgi:hypothetical protein
MDDRAIWVASIFDLIIAETGCLGPYLWADLFKFFNSSRRATTLGFSVALAVEGSSVGKTSWKVIPSTNPKSEQKKQNMGPQQINTK